MEPENQQAPPVVAVVVVHEPGPWFDETLASFAAQDYPNLRFLFLVTGADDEVPARIRATIPDAFVRSLGANPGFGSAANEVLRLVEGDNGFFLICHDDVAPEPDTVRVLVEEIYRSNAGAVGPKFVEWDDPSILRSVGLGLDRFGEIDREIEPGEVDQEQHDGVRDVFVVPSACILVRADLFREIGGFDDSIAFHGEDIELCWRIHHSGARVVVAPAARVRHRGDLPARRPDLNHRVLEARHRMRSVATLTGPTRLPGRVLELVLLTLSEMIVGIFSGRFGEAWASLRALVGLVPRLGSVLARRKKIKPLRRVPEREVLGLQVRGSSRLRGFVRARETSTFVGADRSVRRWRESTTAPVITWIVLIAALVLGSRQFFTSGVPAVGEFLPFPESPGDLLDSFQSGRNDIGVVDTAANPTGWAVLSILSVFTLFRMAAFQVVFIVGLVVFGLIGLWKLVTVFPSTRARIGALAVYASTPLIGGAMSAGRLTTLVAFAATPWIVHSVRRAVGLETADPRVVDRDIVDGVLDLTLAERVRRVVVIALVVGLAAAFAPVMVPVAVVVVVLLAVGSALAFAPWRTTLTSLAVGVAGIAGGVVLNFPWVSTWTWDQLVGAPPIGDPGRGLLDVASMQIGSGDFVALTLAWYVPVIAAILIGQAWRLTWAVRAGVLVVGFGAIAVLADRGSLPFAAPEAGVLLAPVAVGLALSAASALAAFDLDIRGASFGWKQPLGVIAAASIVVGVFPGIGALADGRWDTPTTPLARLLDRQLPPVDERGDYHVLLLGDARVLPVPSIEYRDGIAFALVDDEGLDVRDRWASLETDATDSVRVALDEMASSSTLRAGRLLAPLGIRFIVVPEIDDVESTAGDPLALPSGLVDALADQLDLSSASDSLPTVEMFENTSWIPVVSLLDGATAEASRTAGAGALVQAELDDFEPIFVGADPDVATTMRIDAGVVHVAVPFDDHWALTVDGRSIEPRRAFGLTTAFDVEQPGTATFEYEEPGGRRWLLLVQFVLWAGALFVATRISVGIGRRRTQSQIADETLIDFDGSGSIADPGLDLSGQIARPTLEELPDPEPASASPSDVPLPTPSDVPTSTRSDVPLPTPSDVPTSTPSDVPVPTPSDESGPTSIGEDRT